MSALLPLETAQIPLREDSQLGNRTKHAPLKRKAHEDDVGDSGMVDLITIRSHISIEERIRQLRPRQIIQRSALPLSYLHLTTCDESGGWGLFTAHIRILEASGESLDNDPRILIAQEQDETLVAVERVSKGIYAICRLAPWVRLADFGRTAVKRTCTAVMLGDQRSVSNGEWWSDISTKPCITENRTPHSLVQFVLADKAQAVKSAKKITPKKVEPVLVRPLETSTADASCITQGTEAVNWQQTIRGHYLDALYTTRGPLAYFIKGPLSRARVACQTPESEENLAQLLRSNVLPVKLKANAAVIDKKYNEAIPQLLQQVPSGMIVEDNAEVVALSHEKVTKSKRRKKITSDGLLPGEEECIINWWIKRESTTSHEGMDETREKRTRQAIVDQKTRETQLQIILILEILALEKQAASMEQTDASNNKQNPTSQDSVGKENDTTKGKKLQDLPKTLDMLVEKLQIWETMNEDLITVQGSAEKDASQDSSSLRTFCLDIVLPFFTSRVPEISKSLCKKFGFAKSPEKKIQRSLSYNKLRTKPGEPSKERRSQKPLNRVLTNDMVTTKPRHPSLVRSATDSLVPSIKQEFEDVSLSSNPSFRQPVQQSKLYTRREVDLTAEVKATEAKLKRKAEVEQELKGAIFALKRPNARLAVKEFVDASDRRKVSQNPRSRKSQNPMRNPFATGVQVTATPRANRQRMHNLMDRDSQAVPEIEEPDNIPPSSIPRIPSSSMKPRGGQLGVFNAENISVTPSKPSKSISNSRHPRLDRTQSMGTLRPVQSSQLMSLSEHEDSGSEPELPTMRPPIRASTCSGIGVTTIGATPVKTTSSSRHTAPSQSTSDMVFSTPRKQTSDGDAAVMDSSPVHVRGYKDKELMLVSAGKSAGVTETSIYDALGWDDDLYEI